MTRKSIPRAAGSAATTGATDSAELAIGLSAAILAVTAEVPLVLIVHPFDGDRAVAASDRASSRNPVLDTLPFGPLDPSGDRTLERALRGWVRAQTGFELGYAEQLYTFADRDRFLGEQDGVRVVSVAYVALVREARPAGEAEWRGCYEYLPWEDWRGGRPQMLDREIEPALRRWASAGAESERRDRAEIAFGLGGAPWDPDRVLDRYELLYEAGLVAEASRDRRDARASPSVSVRALGRPMAFDHRRILATALGRLRGKLRYRPVVFELLAPTFTLLQLQQVVEALAGARLHKQNFRRLVEKGGLVEGTGRVESNTGGRPAELFRFRREVLRERPAPGVVLRAGR
ncbi:MAG: hypothetical protein ABI609_18035 [Acidobacteriota bacterium]